ncbi:hypothetical protein D3C81_734290 [compost metagenome]
MVMLLELVTSKVYPSGAALAASPTPISPFAPALFSTTTGWPRDLVRRSESTRATVSVNDPAGNGTIIRIGLPGQPLFCAAAGAAIVVARMPSVAAAMLNLPAFALAWQR